MTTNPNTTNNTHYSDVDLAEFKQLIEAKLLVEQANLASGKADLQTFTDNHADEDDEFSGEQSTLQERIQNLNKKIKGFESALVRIKQKTYGVCTTTGKLIDKRRLLAMPTTLKSLAAENAAAK